MLKTNSFLEEEIETWFRKWFPLWSFLEWERNETFLEDVSHESITLFYFYFFPLAFQESGWSWFLIVILLLLALIFLKSVIMACMLEGVIRTRSKKPFSASSNEKELWRWLKLALKEGYLWSAACKTSCLTQLYKIILFC